MAGQTPWQTTGPFLHFGLPWNGAADLTGDSDLGARPDLIAPGHITRCFARRQAVSVARPENRIGRACVGQQERAHHRFADRDLAGQRGGPLRAP